MQHLEASISEGNHAVDVLQKQVAALRAMCVGAQRILNNPAVMSRLRDMALPWASAVDWDDTLADTAAAAQAFVERMKRDGYESALEDLDQIRREERERCAKVCDERAIHYREEAKQQGHLSRKGMGLNSGAAHAETMAAAIRAMGVDDA